MPSPVRQNRFQSFTPLRSTSLRRLKTAFSPSRRSLRSTSPSSSTGTTSPLARTASPDSHRSSGSAISSHSSLRQLLALRRKPSVLDIQMEEERHLFSTELEMLEPRPSLNGGVEMGIFEVLDGKF